MIWSPWLWQLASYLSEFASWALKLIVSQFCFLPTVDWIKRRLAAKQRSSPSSSLQSSPLQLTDTLNLFPQLLHIISFTHLLLISWSPFSQLCGRESAKCLQIYIKQNRSNLIIPFSRASPKTSAIWGPMAERNKLRKKKKCHVMKKLRGSCDLIVFFHYACKAIKSQMLTWAWHCATCAKADSNNPDRICWWRPGWYLADNHKHIWQIPAKISTECDQSHLHKDNVFLWFGWLSDGSTQWLCHWLQVVARKSSF